MKRYNPTAIEAKWQAHWFETKAYQVKDDDPRPKYYNLVEFPYPSGAGLHVGHCRPYVTFDVMSRWRRLMGENVLYPMGWDSFGLPAEQYAIKTGVHPSEVTVTNINNFREQEKKLGLSFDWSREFSTSDPKVYKWTQWIFLNMFKHGLAYQAESLVWWCEDLKSVLADEEVINGRSERGGFPCERKPLRQWMLAITKYADRLDADLDEVDYTNSVKVQQRNWIGRSTGADITFKVVDSDKTITVYTTRADTIFSCAFIVLAPENDLVSQITTKEHQSVVAKYVHETSSKSDLERQEEGDKGKTGAFTGAYAVNPANGEKVPIWIADFVLAGYGTGAVFGDIHDERDFAFLSKFKIPARVTVIPEDPVEANKVKAKEYAYTGEGILIDSGEFSGMPSSEARDKIIVWLNKKGSANEKVNYKLRDWVFSRQRYWGEPFPIVWVEQEAAKPVAGQVAEWLPKEPVTKQMDGMSYIALPLTPARLPIELPEVADFQPKGLGQGPLAEAKDWVNVWYNLETAETTPYSSPKPTTGNWVEGNRETDTMPNWAGSSWYFLRYLDHDNDNELASKDKISQWMPVNWYNGGTEHTTLHLLYSRFWHKFLYDIGVVNTNEPYKKRTSHGIVLADDGRKMSKSWDNVIDPMSVVGDYGADTLRLYIAFIGPFEQTVAWNSNGVAGCRRFIDRFWTIVQDFISSTKAGAEASKISNPELSRIINLANQKITGDIPRLGFNTAVASLMQAVNSLYKLQLNLAFDANQNDWQAAFNQLVILAAPFIPHVCEELWSQLGNQGSVLNSKWPTLDESALVTTKVVVVIQINGKLRGELNVPLDTSEAEIVDLATKDPKIADYLKAKTIVRKIYIKNKLLNFVIN